MNSISGKDKVINLSDESASPACDDSSQSSLNNYLLFYR